jgi:hypothetical protein
MWFYGKMPLTAYMGGRSFAATPFRTKPDLPRPRLSPYNTDYSSPQDASNQRWLLAAPSPDSIMAGIVRQPIDTKSLERYISQNVPEIKVPIDLKQVLLSPALDTRRF